MRLRLTSVSVQGRVLPARRCDCTHWTLNTSPMESYSVKKVSPDGSWALGGSGVNLKESVFSLQRAWNVLIYMNWFSNVHEYCNV